jgi:NADH-quinone oxidoreductase subunit M
MIWYQSSILWIEVAVIAALIGAVYVEFVRDIQKASRISNTISFFSFFATLLSMIIFYTVPNHAHANQGGLFTPPVNNNLFKIDDLNATLIPVVALLHFLTAYATPRIKMQRFSFSWVLVSTAIRIAIFACSNPRLLIGLAIAEIVPPLVDLWNRGKSVRVYLFHMALFVGLLLIGWNGTPHNANDQATFGTYALLLAILIRSGSFPAHCWITDLFENASFGIALLTISPITGMYLAIKLLLPVVPDWLLTNIETISLITAIYAAGMAVIQTNTRRLFAFLFLSHSSLVLVGMEMHTQFSLTGALALWFSVMISLGGLGITLRAIEARFGQLSLKQYHGLYEHTPTLGVFYLITGLATVGFPFTLGFIAMEVLVDGAVHVNPWLGLVVILVGAINGIAIIRSYLLIFTGTKHVASVSLRITRREQIAILVLAILIIGGGLFPQPGLTTRHHAAEEILKVQQIVAQPN